MPSGCTTGSHQVRLVAQNFFMNVITRSSQDFLLEQLVSGHVYRLRKSVHPMVREVRATHSRLARRLALQHRFRKHGSRTRPLNEETIRNCIK